MDLAGPRSEMMETPYSSGKRAPFVLRMRQVSKVNVLEEMDGPQLSFSEVIGLTSDCQGVLNDEVGFLGIHGSTASKGGSVA